MDVAKKSLSPPHKAQCLTVYGGTPRSRADVPCAQEAGMNEAFCRGSTVAMCRPAGRISGHICPPSQVKQPNPTAGCSGFATRLPTSRRSSEIPTGQMETCVLYRHDVLDGKSERSLEGNSADTSIRVRFGWRDDWGSISGTAPTHPPMQIILGVKRPGREADRSPPQCRGQECVQGYSTCIEVFMTWCLF
jgi:hypothetical protein